MDGWSIWFKNSTVLLCNEKYDIICYSQSHNFTKKKKWCDTYSFKLFFYKEKITFLGMIMGQKVLGRLGKCLKPANPKGGKNLFCSIMGCVFILMSLPCRNLPLLIAVIWWANSSMPEAESKAMHYGMSFSSLVPKNLSSLLCRLGHARNSCIKWWLDQCQATIVQHGPEPKV